MVEAEVIVVDEPESEQVLRVHTACKNCIFADYVGTTQTGCKLGRVEAFRAQGNLLEAEDEEKEFFIINGRYCNAAQQAEGKFAKQFKPEDWVATMRKALQVRMAFIVILSKENDLHVLEATNESIKAQALLPHQVVFVSNQNVVKPAEIHARIFKQLGNDVTWRITQIFERTREGGFVPQERAIDHAMNAVTSGWYSIFNPGAVIPPSFIKDIDVALNDKMERFSLLLPTEDGNALTVQTEMHTHSSINGNMPMVYEVEKQGEQTTTTVCLNTIAEKLQFYAEQEDRKYMIRSVQEICPSLQNPK